MNNCRKVGVVPSSASTVKKIHRFDADVKLRKSFKFLFFHSLFHFPSSAIINSDSDVRSQQSTESLEIIPFNFQDAIKIHQMIQC